MLPNKKEHGSENYIPHWNIFCSTPFKLKQNQIGLNSTADTSEMFSVTAAICPCLGLAEKMAKKYFFRNQKIFPIFYKCSNWVSPSSIGATHFPTIRNNSHNSATLSVAVEADMWVRYAVPCHRCIRQTQAHTRAHPDNTAEIQGLNTLCVTSQAGP